MAKNKKGFDMKEYPKLIKVEGIMGKVRVLNKEEEAKYMKDNKVELKDNKKNNANTNANWGK